MDEKLLELLARCGAGDFSGVASGYAVMQAAPSTTEAVIFTADTLFQNMVCPEIIISGIEPGNGYEGGEMWANRLYGAGVPETSVIFMGGARVGEVGDPASCNTLTEMCALVKHLNAMGENMVLLIAPNFHLPRVLTSFVTALAEEGKSFISAWGIPANVGDWGEKIVHSQGVLAGSVRELFQSEIGKISGSKRYPNLVEIEEVIKYLDERDSHLA